MYIFGTIYVKNRILKYFLEMHFNFMKIFGDGNNTRDFVAIEDVVNAFHLAIDKLEGKKGTIYNIATSEHISINDLAKMMISISGKNLHIEHIRPLDGEIKHSQASISRAQTELGFFPKLSLRDGLELILNSTYL